MWYFTKASVKHLQSIKNVTAALPLVADGKIVYHLVLVKGCTSLSFVLLNIRRKKNVFFF